MLQRTVIPKKSLPPKIDATTMTPLTKRYGASLRRNLVTGSAFQRRYSSGVGPVGAASSFVDEPVYDGVDDRVSDGIGGGGGGTNTGRSVAGRRPVSSAVTTIDAFANRCAGSFSSSVMTTTPRSCGTSARRCSTGVGRSEMCLTRIAGVLLAVNGGSPVSI